MGDTETRAATPEDALLAAARDERFLTLGRIGPLGRSERALRVRKSVKRLRARPVAGMPGGAR
jgi:hypothetical protein